MTTKSRNRQPKRAKARAPRAAKTLSAQTLASDTSSTAPTASSAKASKSKKQKEFILKPWLVGQLRRIFRRYPPFYKTRDRVKEEYFETTKAGKPRRRVKFMCEQCKQWYASSAIAVDHKEPVVGPEGFVDWNTYIPRLFCAPENLQVLCHGCHDAKSAEEQAERRKK